MSTQPSSPPAASRRRFGHVQVLLNAGARRAPGAAAKIRAQLAAAGWGHAHLRVLADGAAMAVALDRAVAEQPDLLVVGGGDGTVTAAAHRVAGTGTVLGVLPLGTANDFARTVEVPVDLRGAVRTLVEGHVVDVDLGRTGDHSFLNAASIGLSVAVTERLTPRLKKRLGPLAYPAATLMAYRGTPGFAARLEFPAGDRPPLELDDVLQVTVGNGVRHGGGNLVGPEASIDDHTLDVYAISRGRLGDHVSIARFLKDGRFIEHELVHHVRTPAVRVHAEAPDGSALPVNADGELVSAAPATFRVERNALHVLVPTTSAAARWDGSSDPHGEEGGGPALRV
ncbi:YegS/Rv2252/BmrU family lipid kinase [Nocardioides bruguierae]|uniref:YegS/Rv2252/BmrU family lipid kinase n=1 Tax=Nocardioides bruguierae TaxID=2945102 RepID=UPI0020213793|nr:YegS/Rv2252/BmrU family lipid kinase [Nocardioides bruguierae]MCL8024288.1 YegS/Rv2252/BmrU family lipid kinase [Nocardioides bruguierae]